MDTIMTFKFIMPNEMAIHVAKAARDRRLSLNLSQQSLSARSGVSYGVLKKFESTGEISLKSLLKLALALGCLEDFLELFKQTSPEKLPSLDDLINQKIRKRGRI